MKDHILNYRLVEKALPVAKSVLDKLNGNDRIKANNLIRWIESWLETPTYDKSTILENSVRSWTSPKNREAFLTVLYAAEVAIAVTWNSGSCTAGNKEYELMLKCAKEADSSVPF